MARHLRRRLSLGGRLVVAFLFVGAVSLTVALTAALVTGLFVFLGLAGVALVMTIFLSPLTEGTVVAEMWPLSRPVILTVVLLSGSLLATVLYVPTVRDEIRTFEAELGSTGTSAEDRHPEIASATRRLAQQADIPEPETRIVNRRRPESYSLADSAGGTIVITRGIIRQLDDDEIEAVLAHEVSHLANRDSRVLRWLLVPMVVAEHVGADERPQVRNGHLFPGIGYAALLLGWLCLELVTAVQLLLCQLGVALLSRGRELAADTAAAELTGSPATLASALQKLDDARSRPSEDKREFMRTVGVLDILPVEDRHLIEGPFRTHPRTERRIACLESLAVELERER